MRIGISTSVIQRGQTGIAQYLFALLRAFLWFTQRHEFVLFVLEEDSSLFEFLENHMEIVPVPEKFRSPVKNIAWHQTRLPQLARSYSLDVLHVPSYRRMLWPKPCALVATIHDLAQFHLKGKYDWKRMFYGRVIARKLAGRQDQLIAISKNTARDVRDFLKVDLARVTVIHNGLEHERFFPGSQTDAKQQTAQRYGLRFPFFLYVARLEHPGKNHVRLISAFNQFKSSTRSNWQLALGGSDWHGAEVIHKASMQSPFRSDIRLLGFIPNEALANLYRAADVFVYPSLYEGFGMPPTEAMACGCPVICSTSGSLGEIVGQAAAIVDPRDTVSIAEQLIEVSGNMELRNNLRKAGLARAREFDWQKAAAQTLEVYGRAAGPPFPMRKKRHQKNGCEWLLRVRIHEMPDFGKLAGHDVLCNCISANTVAEYH